MGRHLAAEAIVRRLRAGTKASIIQNSNTRGDVSTNEAEAFSALFKRGITGSFHSVSKVHLHRYCNEFSFRWNERKTSDADRTAKALSLIGGGRLMYKDPIRKRVE
jgi:ISXO2-like transposase domain